LWLAECDKGDPGAGRQADPSRAVEITLEEALAGRVVIDGVYRLVTPEGPAEHPSDLVPWTRVHVWDPHTLVVYWFGAALYPLDRIETTLTKRSVRLAVLEQPAGRLSGAYKAAIVRLDEPLSGRRIKQGPASR
jgi:hypothetical protein